MGRKSIRLLIDNEEKEMLERFQGHRDHMDPEAHRTLREVLVPFLILPGLFVECCNSFARSQQSCLCEARLG